MSSILSVSPEANFFKKLITFNKMATLTIKSNKITGLRAIVVRLTVIIDSFSLFIILKKQKEMMSESLYGLIKIVETQKRLNLNGVAYTFPIPEQKLETNEKVDLDPLKDILSKIDHSKLPRN